ncbi:MAG: hypothetical protein CSA15_13360 [Candidatus Delongbacteria bacterium]|nr:MAG: hypothetical protein CSA15_13360 [Candidatus Delongbacteria bacterium]
MKLIEYKAVSVKPKQNLKKSKKLVFKKKKVKRQRPIIQHNTTCFIKKTPQSTSIYSVMGKVYNKVAYNIQILFLFLCCLLALLFLFDLVLKGFKRYSYVFIDKLKTYSLYSRPPTFSY